MSIPLTTETDTGREPQDAIPLEHGESEMLMRSGDTIGDQRDMSRWVPHLLAVTAILVAAVTFIGLATAVPLAFSPQPRIASGQVLAFAVLLIVGLAAVGTTLGLLILYRQSVRMSEQLTTLDQQTAILAEQSLARTQADTYAGKPAPIDPGEMRELLARIHEALLLPEQERARRFRAIVEREFARRLAAIQAFIGSRDFHRARQELASLAERFGMDQRVEQARQQLEAAAGAAQASDIVAVAKHVEGLMSTAKWDEAEHQARELAEKYPLAAEATALIERVDRERKLFELKHRQRMHDEIQQFVNERRWQEALTAARQFVHTFPVGPDTEVLRQQLETLEANAEIQARQTLERYIKQYIRDKQYWDALALARRIISEYPLSPQANVLRAQVPRLEELARKQAT